MSVNFVDEINYIDRLTLTKRRDLSDDRINFCCPICLEGKSFGKKARGWLKKNSHGSYYYTCFNCGVYLSFYKFLEQVDTILFEEYKEELFRNNFDQLKEKAKEKKEKIIDFKPRKHIKTHKQEKDGKCIEKEEKAEIQVLTTCLEEDLSPIGKLKQETKFFKKLNKNFKSIMNYPEYIDYCESRFLSENVYSKFFVYDKPGKNYSYMLILPLYDNQTNEIYGFNARSISQKQFHIEIPKGNPDVVDIFNVDDTKPIYVVESQFDQMLIKNSISCLGAGKMEHYISLFKNATPCLDNDHAGYITSLKLAKEGYPVVLLFDEFESYGVKDIGEYREQVSDVNFERLLKANTFKGSKALSRLKKIKIERHYSDTINEQTDWDKIEKINSYTLKEKLEFKRHRKRQ